MTDALPKPERFSAPLEDGAIAGLRWRRDGAPRVLFAHATGFCASAYKQMLGLLASTFDVYAIDQRGHGRSTLPTDPARLISWRPYANDIAAFLDAAPGCWRLAGHSMGAVAVLLAAQGRRDIDDVALVEPVVMPISLTMAAHTPFWRLIAPYLGIARQAARRRSQWASRDEILERYRSKGLFSRWRPGALEDYLEDGLVAGRDGGVRLACDPVWEAATFSAQANHFWAAARRAGGIRILTADHPSTTAGGLARVGFRLIGAPLTILSDVTHLAPMEEPAAIARFIAARGEHS